MSKRNVAYIKPQEPSFLTKLKQQAGYKEGPTVETKREALPEYNDDDFEDDQPVVVVLKPGDLTADEAENIRKQEEVQPARLDEPIVFRKPNREKQNLNGNSDTKVSSTATSTVEVKKRSSSESSGSSKRSKSSKSSQKSSNSLLSFDTEEDEES